MSSLADKLIAEGERRGEIKGEVRGEFKGKMKIAQQMLNEGFDLTVIAKVTQLPSEKIITLK